MTDNHFRTLNQHYAHSYLNKKIVNIHVSEQILRTKNQQKTCFYAFLKFLPSVFLSIFYVTLFQPVASFRDFPRNFSSEKKNKKVLVNKFIDKYNGSSLM